MNGCSVLNRAVVFVSFCTVLSDFSTNQTPKDWLDKPLFRLYNGDKREEFS